MYVHSYVCIASYVVTYISFAIRSVYGCIEELTFTVSIIYSYIGTTSSSTSITYV